jgi:hypothetical protein
MERRPMLHAHTDNPPHLPFGKEIGVFVERLEEQMRLLFNILKSVVQLKLQCTPCSLPN